MPTPDEQIKRFQAAHAAAQTPRVTTNTHKGRLFYTVQPWPGGPKENMTPAQFEAFICDHERRGRQFDNGVALSDESGNGPRPEPPPPPPEPDP